LTRDNIINVSVARAEIAYNKLLIDYQEAVKMMARLG